MTTMTAIATTMVFLGIRTSSPHSSAQRTLRPIPRIAQRPEPSEARTPALEEGGQFPDSVRTLWAGLYSPWGRVPQGRGEHHERRSKRRGDGPRGLDAPSEGPGG